MTNDKTPNDKGSPKRMKKNFKRGGHEGRGGGDRTYGTYGTYGANGAECKVQSEKCKVGSEANGVARALLAFCILHFAICVQAVAPWSILNTGTNGVTLTAASATNITIEYIGSPSLHYVANTELGG